MPYTSATVLTNTRQDDGRSILTVQFNGDAGEPPVREDITIDGDTTVLSLRRWAIGIRDRLNNIRTVATLPGLAPGQTIALNSIAPPAPSARDIWWAKAARLLMANELGLTNVAAVSDRSALNADVNATYVAGYL